MNDTRLGRTIEAARPTSLRRYDQIPMYTADLLEQVKRLAPQLAGKSIVFVGDHDCTALVVGLLAARKKIVPPAKICVLDFDGRLIRRGYEFARRHRFLRLYEAQLYNVFDPPPQNLVGKFDAYYTNPPYGASNNGASARLFITRGCELTKLQGGMGYVILPSDAARPWTVPAMTETKRFLGRHGWRIQAETANIHRYHLDDDPELCSSMVVVKRRGNRLNGPRMPWEGCAVPQTEIENFYGKSVRPPYPKYIAEDGHEIYNLDRLYPDGHLERSA